ncbi:MAG: hypothetical protein GXP18_07180 [Gammaproteobacteria bacterium]|nr:hypothetical protein [Gammaproteobacteria bacterium]
MKQQTHPGILVSGLVISLAVAFFTTTAVASPDKHHLKKTGTHISVRASEARLIRRVMGPVANSVNGVPAEPVDSFDWSGSEITRIKGHAKLEIDPVANTGIIKAKWEDEYGYWTYKQTMFAPPSHPTGVRMGASLGSLTVIEDDPVTTNIYLHGDTGAGGPVIPTLFNLLATWGPAKVTLNGEPFDNPFDGPVPMWAGHTMVSEGVRDANGAVRTISGETFNMMLNSEGQTYPDDLVFHLVFHDVPGPEMTANVPPPLSFFYHVTFGKVKINIKHNN